MKSIKKLFLILVLGMLAANLAWAAEFSVKSEVDKNTMDASEVLKLTLEISGLDQGNPDIIIPELDGFIIISTNNFDEVSWVNNELKSLKKIFYFLKATKTGKLIIPEIKVKNKDEECSSSAIAVEVKGVILDEDNEPVEEAAN
jgi:hypothetical protein